MGTILDSVKAMSEKLGVTEEAQTIADQIDLNTEAISGTNPQSRDIAEAVRELAKNDGPDSRLGTKSITANGTYAALDDELDGYSSVTVDVNGDALNFQQVDFAYDGFSSSGYTTMVSVVRNDLGLYDLTDGEVSGTMPAGTVSFRVKNDVVCIDPAVRIYAAINHSGTQTIIFTPSSEFEGIYSQYGTTLVDPSAVTPGDNKTYKYVIPASAKTGTLTKSTSSSTFNNNGYKIVK